MTTLVGHRAPEDSEVRKLAERVLKIYRGAGQVLEYRV